MNEHRIAEQIRERGWSRIAVEGQLEQDIRALFFDICEYLIIVVNDSSTNLRESSLAAFVDAVRSRDVGASESRLQSICLELNDRNRELLGKIYDIGTRPMKLMSGNKLFHNPALWELANQYFTNHEYPTVLTKPHNGETLHVFPPGDEKRKYNLPIHQDFPYLLQSPRQLSFWLNLTNNLNRSSGGIRIYPFTHKLGVVKTTKNGHGHYEVRSDLYPEITYQETVESKSSLFELYATDSLVWHLSIPNTSNDSVRLTYIFRISDIGAPGRLPYGLDTSGSQGSVFEKYYGEQFSNVDESPSIPARGRQNLRETGED